MTFPFPPGGGGGFPPGGGFPGGGFPGGGGPGGPGGPGSIAPPPQGPPPLSRTPQAPRQQPGLYAVDPGSMRPCLFRYVYVWLRNGRSFWFYPVYIGRTSAAGYRWNGFTWTYYGLDLNRIVSFECF